ncbi:MAG: hypothetical protein IJZ68_12585 [Bacteroidaceae bacterium]|nr:hypothetical protein [Bacteroidaceae bacterium]
MPLTERKQIAKGHSSQQRDAERNTVRKDKELSQESRFRNHPRAEKAMHAINGSTSVVREVAKATAMRFLIKKSVYCGNCLSLSEFV